MARRVGRGGIRSLPGRHFLTAAALAALAGPLLVACNGDEADDDPTIEYAALGDSFTAGPWLPESSTDGCFRSSDNYPHQVAAELPDVELVDVSCGGATTDDINSSQEQQGGRVQPPQIDAVSPDTDLVTLGIGGNDLGASYTVVLRCLQVADQDPDGAPCSDEQPELGETMSQIEARLVRALGSLRNRAPDARILLVGYPRLLPENGGCKALPVAVGDRALVRRAVETLAETMRRAARTAEVEFVDTYEASEGHDLCSDDPWVNGPRKDPRSKAAPYHPLPAYQQAVAELILDRL